MSIGRVVAGRDRLLAATECELSVVDVCSEIAAVVDQVASYEWGAVLTTDPNTLLPSAGCVVGFDPSACAPFWDNELLDPDFNKYTDLARRVDPVATLFDAVDGDLERSPRYNKLLRSIGAVDELRITFVAGTMCLAIATFSRSADAGGTFSAAEQNHVRALVPTATRALRAALGRVDHAVADYHPVVVILDRDDQVVAASHGAGVVFDDIRIKGADGRSYPEVIRTAAMQVRSSRSATDLTTRVRGCSGRWYRIHVTALDRSHGANVSGDAISADSISITITPARPDDIVGALLDSFALTERETEVVLGLCRGLSAKEIAAEIMASPHTVRDHIKSIYSKTGVNSRGELVANLFTNHVLARFERAVVHAGPIS